MNTQHTVFCCFLAMVFVAIFNVSCLGQSSPISSKEARELVSKRESDIRELKKAYKLKLQKLDEAFGSKANEINQLAAEKLEKIQSKIAPNDLDDAVRIRDKALEIRNSVVTPLSDKKKGESIETLKNQIRELNKSNASLIRDSEKAQRLALAFPSVEKLIKSIQGTDYKQSNGRVWSFNVDGTLHLTDKAGKNAGRWAAIDANTIVTQIDDGKHIDRFEFTPDRVGYRVKYIGTADKTRRELTGQLIRKN